MSRLFVFRGDFTRHEMGEAGVYADSPEEAVELMESGEWAELAVHAGSTEFEWDGLPPDEA